MFDADKVTVEQARVCKHKAMGLNFERERKNEIEREIDR